uniref:Uncharacterized protein n=1 Tax=Nothobranchius rachovii TaxID=451742 RepID=A0A1A8SHC0_9TELE
MQDFDAAFTPLPVTPTKSPDTKKAKSANISTEGTSNDDILKAVMELSGRFAALEQKITKNTEVIANVCDQLKAVEMHVQKNENMIKDVSEQLVKEQQRSDDALVVRDNSTRPVIIQFTMRAFRNKIWKVSRDNNTLKEKKLFLKEDLSQADRMERNRLWPIVEEARKQGKRAGFRGPHAYIEGKKVTR